MNADDRAQAENDLHTAMRTYLEHTNFPQTERIHQIYADHGYSWSPRPSSDARCPRHWSTRLPCGQCYTPPPTDDIPADSDLDQRPPLPKPKDPAAPDGRYKAARKAIDPLPGAHRDRLLQLAANQLAAESAGRPATREIVILAAALATEPAP